MNVTRRPADQHFPWTLLAVLLLVAAVMWPALSGGFIFDDQQNIVENPAIHITTWNWNSVYNLWAWTQQNIGRPLASLTYAVNYTLGSGPWGFKATNLVIHLFNTVLVALLGIRLLKCGQQLANDGDASNLPNRASTWSLAIAAAWALHPLQISTVMYVVQRMELLSFTFTLLALLAYWRARQQQIDGRRAWPSLLLAASCVVIGYGFKETIALVPGYALLLELTVLHFRSARPNTRRGWQVAYAVGCLSAVMLFVFYLLPHQASDISFSGRDFTASQRVLTQFRVLCMYIGMCILPLPSHMHFYYDNFPVSSGWLQPLTTLLSALLLLSLASLALAVRKRRPLLSLGIAWFFMAHLITSGPIPLEMVFEHRNYPALFGIVLAVADLMWLCTRHAHPRMPAILATILISSLCLFTALRAAAWGNQIQLVLTIAHDNPESSRANYELAGLYLELAQGNNNSPYFTKAIAAYKHCAALPNASVLPEQALILLAANGQTTLHRGWWDSFLHKLKASGFGPQEAAALTAMWKSRIERHSDLDAHQLAQAYEIALQKKPWSDTLYVDYAELASLALHDPKLAIEQWQQALILHRGDLDYARQMATALMNAGRRQEASGVMGFAEEMEPELLQTATWVELRAKLLQGSPPPPPAREGGLELRM